MARPIDPKRAGNAAAWKLEWFGRELIDAATESIREAMADVFLDAEREAKQRLWPGHGVDSGRMKAGVHVDQLGHNWPAEHVEKDEPPFELGGFKVRPVQQGRSNYWGLELGSGQKYAIFYHQKRDPFLAIAARRAQDRLAGEIAKEMARRGYKRK
jgi:hypothetical protein